MRLVCCGAGVAVVVWLLWLDSGGRVLDKFFLIKVDDVTPISYTYSMTNTQNPQIDHVTPLSYTDGMTTAQSTAQKNYLLICTVCHEDDPTSPEDYIIITDDAPIELQKATLLNHESNYSVVTHITREEMDKVVRAIEQKRDTHHFGDGYYVDFTEPHFIGVM